MLVSQLWEDKTDPSAWLCGGNNPELSLPSLFVEHSFILWPVLCTESSCQSELGLGSRAALARQKFEDKVVKTTAENRIIEPMLDQCSHSGFSCSQWEAPRAGDHSSVGTEAAVTKQSCSDLPLSIKNLILWYIIHLAFPTISGHKWCLHPRAKSGERTRDNPSGWGGWGGKGQPCTIIYVHSETQGNEMH